MLSKQNKGGLVVLGIIAAVIAIAIFSNSLHNREVPVRADHVGRGSISNTIFTNGKVEPIQNFEAHAPAAATVKRVLVHEGDWVQAGQLLLQLDDAGARAEAARTLAQIKAGEADVSNVRSGGTREELLTNQSLLQKARTELDDAQRSLTAFQKLLQSGAASRAEVQAADDRLKRAQAEVSLLQAKATTRYSPSEVSRVQAESSGARASYAAAQDLLRNLNVIAPWAGKVYSLPVKPTSYVSGGDLLIQVADLSSVQVRAFVDEPDIGKLAQGQAVTVTWDGLPGRVWLGSVTRVPATVIPRGSRTVGEVTCTVDNHDGTLLPNVDVNATITTSKHDHVLTVPREATHLENSRTYVYEIKEGVLRRTEVQTGISDMTRTEIISGLPENAVVALSTANTQGLHDAMPVRIERN